MSEEEPTIETYDKELEPGMERPMLGEIKRGVWIDREGNVNPEAVIISEAMHANGETYYFMREEDGQEYYAPINEVRILGDQPEADAVDAEEGPTIQTEEVDREPRPIIDPARWEEYSQLMADNRSGLILPRQPFHDFLERTKKRYEGLSPKKRRLVWALGIPIVTNLFGLVSAGVIKTGLKIENEKMDKYESQLKKHKSKQGEHKAKLGEQPEPDSPQAII